MQKENIKNLIDPAQAEMLISAHDADAALLYIYALRRGGLDCEQAAHELCRTMREVRDAEEKLCRMGLLPLSGGAPAPALSVAEALPSDELPQYSARDIARRSKEDECFSTVIDEAQKVMGKTLNSNDLRMIFGIYDHLALPAEVVLELLNFCGEMAAERSEGKRRPSASAIQKEAYIWANREILTLERAEEYISAQRARWSDTGRIASVLGLSKEHLSPSQLKYISSWLDMGFGEDEIAEAMDRTMLNTGKLAWSYMDKIICSWNEKGLHGLSEIREKDGRRSQDAAGRRKSGKPGETKPIDRDTLRKLINKI